MSTSTFTTKTNFPNDYFVNAYMQPTDSIECSNLCQQRQLRLCILLVATVFRLAAVLHSSFHATPKGNK
jgi:hypothetical protein